MKTRKNETELLANQLMQLQNQSMVQMIDISQIKQVSTNHTTQQRSSSLNPLTSPLRETKKFINDQSVTSMPSWVPPTLDEAIEYSLFPDSQKIFSNSFSADKCLGFINKKYIKPIIISKFTKKQLEIIQFKIVTSVFGASKFTIQQLRIQQQMFKACDPIKISFTPIPAFLNTDIQSFLPIPPLDARPRLAMLLTLFAAQTELNEGICAWFLNNRIIDLVESLFWLVWAVIFDGLNCRKKFSEFGIQRKKWEGQDILPEHLDIQEKDLSVIDFLSNRISDDYATIQRSWMGCRGSEKDYIQEYLPYFVANAVHRMFLRTFPQYHHVFSPKFVDDLYNNVVYSFSGILNYPDYQKSVIYAIFGDSQISSVYSVANHLPSGSPLIGAETLDQVDLINVFHGKYFNSTSEISDNMRKTAQFYKSDEQNQNQLDEGAITYSAVIKPIDFDFVLFDELVNINNNFSVDRSSIRNTQVFNKSKAINHITPQLLFQSNQQNQNIFPSLTSAMNAEAIKVVRHAVPRSTLQNLDNTAKLTEKTKKTEEQMYYQAKNRQNAKIYDLDDVQEPSVKYTQIQFEEKKEVKKTKKSYKYEDMVQSDIEAYKQQPPPDAQDNSLRLTQLDTPKIDQKTNSMTIDNTFIIRLPPKYHKFGPQDTHIQQVIQNEVATNNDIIINIHDENYETIINSAISSVKTTHSQKIYKPLPQIKSVQSQEKPQTDAIETLKSHPLRITNQKIHVASVSPLLVRYLQISCAPAPADFRNFIVDSAYLRADLGRSDFVKKKNQRLEGKEGNDVGNFNQSTRAVNVVRRTRNDAWIDPSAIYQDLDDQRISKNTFIDDYNLKKEGLKQREKDERMAQKADNSELEIQKTLFLDQSLKGRNTRVAALSKVVVQEVEDQKKQLVYLILINFDQSKNHKIIFSIVLI
ncbi:hypothetical protein SS50377_26096 [Spironucleus salmonicida]|uniref:Uncharacterized protein n=1 Tax=Spironucleus salmonicida TaxID=348837 RepID=A0A9P8RWW7_9EUKA|nr:hypothetical protein SS50377_26096 [Spironucleus salmonicida]